MAHTNYRRKIKKQFISIWGALPLGKSKEWQRLFWKQVRASERSRDLEDLPRKYRRSIRYDWW
jgi:hypothetical protein